MSQEIENHLILNQNSYQILEIGAKYFEISREEFLDRIISCIEIDEINQTIKLNSIKTKKYRFDLLEIEIIKQFLENCFST